MTKNRTESAVVSKKSVICPALRVISMILFVITMFTTIVPMAVFASGSYVIGTPGDGEGSGGLTGDTNSLPSTTGTLCIAGYRFTVYSDTGTKLGHTVNIINRDPWNATSSLSNIGTVYMYTNTSTGETWDKMTLAGKGKNALSQTQWTSFTYDTLGTSTTGFSVGGSGGAYTWSEALAKSTAEYASTMPYLPNAMFAYDANGNAAGFVKKANLRGIATKLCGTGTWADTYIVLVEPLIGAWVGNLGGSRHRMVGTISDYALFQADSVAYIQQNYGVGTTYDGYVEASAVSKIYAVGEQYQHNWYVNIASNIGGHYPTLLSISRDNAKISSTYTFDFTSRFSGLLNGTTFHLIGDSGYSISGNTFVSPKYNAWGGYPLGSPRDLITTAVGVGVYFGTEITSNPTATTYTLTGTYATGCSSTMGSISGSPISGISGGASYTVSGTTITCGTKTITASANSGYRFIGWYTSADHKTLATSGTINGNTTLYAYFEKQTTTTYTLTIIATPTGYGTVNGTTTVTISGIPSGTAINRSGSTLSCNNTDVKATPAATSGGYTYSFVSYSTSSSSSSAPPATITKDLTIYARFTRATETFEIKGLWATGCSYNMGNFVVRKFNGSTLESETVMEGRSSATLVNNIPYNTPYTVSSDYKTLTVDMGGGVTYQLTVNPKANYEFVGWCGSSRGGFVRSGSSNITEDKRIFARLQGDGDANLEIYTIPNPSSWDALFGTSNEYLKIGGGRITTFSISGWGNALGSINNETTTCDRMIKVTKGSGEVMYFEPGDTTILPFYKNQDLIIEVETYPGSGEMIAFAHLYGNESDAINANGNNGAWISSCGSGTDKTYYLVVPVYPVYFEPNGMGSNGSYSGPLGIAGTNTISREYSIKQGYGGQDYISGTAVGNWYTYGAVACRPAPGSSQAPFAIRYTDNAGVNQTTTSDSTITYKSADGQTHTISATAGIPDAVGAYMKSNTNGYVTKWQNETNTIYGQSGSTTTANSVHKSSLSCDDEKEGLELEPFVVTKRQLFKAYYEAPTTPGHLYLNLNDIYLDRTTTITPKTQITGTRGDDGYVHFTTTGSNITPTYTPYNSSYVTASGDTTQSEVGGPYTIYFEAKGSYNSTYHKSTVTGNTTATITKNAENGWTVTDQYGNNVDGVTISASSSNLSVFTVEASGNTITITGVSTGDAILTVTAQKSGYESYSCQVMVYFTESTNYGMTADNWMIEPITMVALPELPILDPESKTIRLTLKAGTNISSVKIDNNTAGTEVYVDCTRTRTRAYTQYKYNGTVYTPDQIVLASICDAIAASPDTDANTISYGSWTPASEDHNIEANVKSEIEYAVGTASVTVNKDGAAYTGLDVDLYSGTTKKYDLTYSSGKYTKSEVASGTYNIYIGGNDTGVDITVSKGTTTYAFEKWTIDSYDTLASETTAYTTVTHTQNTTLTASATATDNKGSGSATVNYYTVTIKTTVDGTQDNPYTNTKVTVTYTDPDGNTVTKTYTVSDSGTVTTDPIPAGSSYSIKVMKTESDTPPSQVFTSGTLSAPLTVTVPYYTLTVNIYTDNKSATPYTNPAKLDGSAINTATTSKIYLKDQPYDVDTTYDKTCVSYSDYFDFESGTITAAKTVNIYYYTVTANAGTNVVKVSMTLHHSTEANAASVSNKFLRNRTTELKALTKAVVNITRNNEPYNVYAVALYQGGVKMAEVIGPNHQFTFTDLPTGTYDVYIKELSASTYTDTKYDMTSSVAWTGTYSSASNSYTTPGIVTAITETANAAQTTVDLHDTSKPVTPSPADTLNKATYKVNYYLQSDNGTYELYETEVREISWSAQTVTTNVSPDVAVPTGYLPNETRIIGSVSEDRTIAGGCLTVTITPASNGLTHVDYYYKKKTVTMTYVLNGGTYNGFQKNRNRQYRHRQQRSDRNR